MLTLCFIGILALAGISAGGIYYNVRHNQKSDIVSQAFVDFFCSQDEGGVTDFDKSLYNLAQTIANNQANIMTASIRGRASAATKAIDAGLQEEAQEVDPVSAMIMENLPKKIKKNEYASMAMTSILKKAIEGSGKLPAGSSFGDNRSNGKQVKFTL
jgi:hypothetical protein